MNGDSASFWLSILAIVAIYVLVRRYNPAQPPARPVAKTHRPTPVKRIKKRSKVVVNEDEDLFP